MRAKYWLKALDALSLSLSRFQCGCVRLARFVWHRFFYVYEYVSMCVCVDGVVDENLRLRFKLGEVNKQSICLCI